MKIANSRSQLANLTLIQTKTTQKSLPFSPPTPIWLLCRRFVQSPVLIFMSFTRFRQSLCFTFFLQSPFFTFVGSKVGVTVGALASHLCDPGSVPVVGTWVEFFCWFCPCSEGFFFRVLQIFLPPQKPTLPNSNSTWTSSVYT